jgi:hypothetical protein
MAAISRRVIVTTGEAWWVSWWYHDTADSRKKVFGVSVLARSIIKDQTAFIQTLVGPPLSPPGLRRLREGRCCPVFDEKQQIFAGY